jgi:zinc protease
MSALKTENDHLDATANRIQRVVSKAGVEAWLVEEYAVPLIAVEFAFDGGTAQDGAGKAGLAALMAGLLDEGAGPYDSVAFQELLEEHAIQLSFSESRDAFYGSLKTLTRHKAKAFELLALAVNQPRFDAPAVERVRAQIISGLKRAMNDPGSVSSKTWMETAFAGHAYGAGERGTLETMAALSIDDLRALFKRMLARKTLKVAVVGAISAKELAIMLDDVFGGLPETPELTDIKATAPAGLGEVKISDLDIPQSTIRFGMTGLLRKDDDFIPATVMNHILGGGSFTSRIWQEVREKRGLAYSVSTGLYPYARAGMFYGGTATKNERAKEALDVIREEISRMATEGPTADELDKAQKYLIGSYALRFDTSTKIANQLLGMMMDDLGIDYTARRNGLVQAVTLTDTAKVAKRLLADGKMLVTVAGRPEGF